MNDKCIIYTIFTKYLNIISKKVHQYIKPTYQPVKLTMREKSKEFFTFVLANLSKLNKQTKTHFPPKPLLSR